MDNLISQQISDLRSTIQNYQILKYKRSQY